MAGTINRDGAGVIIACVSKVENPVVRTIGVIAANLNGVDDNEAAVRRIDQQISAPGGTWG